MDSDFRIFFMKYFSIQNKDYSAHFCRQENRMPVLLPMATLSTAWFETINN